MPVSYGTVYGPAAASAIDGSTGLPIMQGKSGEQVVTELHGKYYTSNYRNRVFTATSLIAGVTIPVQTTTAPTWTIFNPIGSGVNVSLISFDMGLLAGSSMVIGTIMAGVSVQTPTSPTAVTPFPAFLGAAQGTAQAKVYSAATIVAVAVNQLRPLLQITTTTGQLATGHYDFDGSLILAPGAMASIFSNPVQTSATFPSFTWEEYPV